MVDSEPHSLTSWRVVLAERQVDLEQAVIDRIFGLRHIETAHILVSVYHLAEDPFALAREKEEYQIAHLHGQIVPMPGLRPLFEELERCGLGRAVASSGTRRYVETVLWAIGVTDYFQARVCG